MEYIRRKNRQLLESKLYVQTIWTGDFQYIDGNFDYSQSTISESGDFHSQTMEDGNTKESGLATNIQIEQLSQSEMLTMQQVISLSATPMMKARIGVAVN